MHDHMGHDPVLLTSRESLLSNPYNRDSAGLNEADVDTLGRVVFGDPDPSESVPISQVVDNLRVCDCSRWVVELVLDATDWVLQFGHSPCNIWSQSVIQKKEWRRGFIRQQQAGLTFVPTLSLCQFALEKRQTI